MKAPNLPLVPGNHPATLTVSKDHLLPVSCDVFDNHVTMLDRSEPKFILSRGKLASRIVASGYREYAKGIWFPSLVTVTNPRSTMEYRLVKAAFNEAVDPKEVLLPVGMRVADARFGESRGLASYKVNNGQLPGDAEVRWTAIFRPMKK